MTGRDKPCVFVEPLGEPDKSYPMIGALDYLNIAPSIDPSTRVFIKPNLTWPNHLPGVTTSPRAIESLVVALKDHTDRVVIGESDGGYHSYLAEEAFQGHGLSELERRYGVRLVNLSRLPVRSFQKYVAGKEVLVDLPPFLMEEIDLFITMPVPKVHAMTGVSLAFKNQWGCIPKTMRLREHPQFAHKILAINQLLNPRLAVFDGRYFLDRNGPLAGLPVEMNLLLASNDIGAGSVACCSIMGIDPMKVPHLRLAQKAGMLPDPLDRYEANRPLDPFRGHHFTLQRTALNRATYLAFRSNLATRLIYDSSLARPIHQVLYWVRRNPLVRRLLYGRWGYVEARQAMVKDLP